MSDASKNLKETQNTVREASKLNAMLKSQLSQASQILSKNFSVSSAVTLVVSKTKEAVAELKEMNTLLTQISRSNQNLSKSDLQGIGTRALDAAGRYGTSASNYLAAFQAASNAGYQDAEGIAELSLAVQNAGGMTADLADQLIHAADQAYHMHGSVTELTNALDGITQIAGRNKISMAELADGISIVSSTAASFGMDAAETASALSTIITATGQGGAEAAGALEAILLNLRQVADSSAGIDTDSLAGYEAACGSLNVKLRETKDGVASLRDPMDVLKELAGQYSRLGETDVRRTNLLDSVGGGTNADALDALLRNYDTYSNMMSDYAQGTGSMAAEAAKNTDSWEGALNRLSNTWTAAVGSLTDSDGIIFLINSLNSLLSVINSITGSLGSWGSIGAGIGLFAGIKNAGRVKCSPSYRICPQLQVSLSRGQVFPAALCEIHN